MTRTQAIHHGFTHEGWYGVLPIWFREPDSSVVGKNWIADVLIPVVGGMDWLAGLFVLDPHFWFRVRPIEREGRP